MLMKCHVKTFGRIVCAVGLCAFLSQPSFSESKSASVKAKPKLAQADNGSITFDELDETERTGDSDDKTKTEEEGAVNVEVPAKEAVQPRAKRSPLPTVDQLIEAKISALRKEQEKQEQALAAAEQKLARERAVEQQTFDNNAYFSLTMKNSAPWQEYELRNSEVYVDGKRIARGGKRNNGLPRNSESIFFGAVQPGCHDVEVRAQYVRLKNDLISRFKVDRVEHVSRHMSFVAKNGYRIELAIEGFEQHNSLVNWKRGPALRFNRLVRPNFLPGAPIITMDDVLKQGRVHIEYVTQDSSQHRLIEKSLSIDGLPILVKETHDVKKDKAVVFDAPLAEGKHTLNAVLLFGEQKRVKGGPLYNFRLSFNRDFYVVSGQATFLNLDGMPHDGFRRAPEDTRYARVTSQIRSEEFPDMFSEMTCAEQRDKQAVVEQKKNEKASKAKPVVTPKEAKPQNAKAPADEKATPPSATPSSESAEPVPVEKTTPDAGAIPIEPIEPSEMPAMPLLPKTEQPSPGFPPGPIIEPDTNPQSMNEENGDVKTEEESPQSDKKPATATKDRAPAEG